MLIETKYNFGDLVYPITTRFETLQIPTNCPACNDKGKVELNDKQYTCPKCNGHTYHNEEGDIEYYVYYKSGKVGKLDIDLYAPNNKSYKSELRYMLDSTGVGSGSCWEEDNLFPSKEEAQTECDKRNIARKLTIAN